MIGVAMTIDTADVEAVGHVSDRNSAREDFTHWFVLSTILDWV